MSDRFGELSRAYRKHVSPEHSRNSGLFPIPEYPEHEEVVAKGMWSSALDVILTTLRYLAPATLLTLFWGQQSFLFRLLKHIDLTIKSIIYSCDEQRDSVLRWLEEAGPVKVERLDTVWRHGWILCGVLDSALPGACKGHPPTRLSLKHAQVIADNYLGVEPVFSRQELESNDSLSKRQEWRLAQYLDRIRQALAKVTPPVSKPNSQRTSPDNMQYTLDYVSRGSGLIAAQIDQKAYFKIYPTGQQPLDPAEITILIKGPRDTYGMTVIPPLLGKVQMIRQKIIGLQSKRMFTGNALPFTHGATYLRAYGKNDMKKTYHIPKAKYDIEIDVNTRPDHVKVGYIAPLEGKYEISIISRGQNIVGSPFNVKASNNIIGTLERDSFCLEDGEEIDIVDIDTDKKAVLRIVDFVTEKMILRDNGSLEKITAEEAELLIGMDNIVNQRKSSTTNKTYTVVTDSKLNKFKEVGIKIKTMIKVCKILNDTLKQNQTVMNNKTLSESKKNPLQQVIPDLVNSTLIENAKIRVNDSHTQIKIPDSITLLLKSEKTTKKIYEEPKQIVDINNANNNMTIYNKISSSNPFNVDFHCDVEGNILIKKEMDEHVPLPQNFALNAQEENIPIKIFVENEADKEEHTHNINPFVDTAILERPKTPILKIITNELHDRLDSPFIMSNNESLNDESYGSNEFINPGFAHVHRFSLETQNENVHFPTADFIIGAPVSLPPLLKAPSPEPDNMDSIILASNLDDALHKYEIKVQVSKKRQELNNDESTCTSPEENTKPSEQVSYIVNSTFHSIDSDHNDTSRDSYQTQNNSYGEYSVEEFEISNKDICIAKKDIWDSAYVSIDDNNSSPDTNNEHTTINEICSKQKFSLNEIKSFNMGPAELEIWQTCKDLGDATSKISEDVKICKWEFKRPAFTPILEESDRSLLSGIREKTETETIINERENDPVTMAFAELNDIFQEYCANSENNSLTLSHIENSSSKEVEYTVEEKVVNVDSASVLETDVMRQRINNVEGTISGVQANVTESSPVSRALHDENNHADCAIQTEILHNINVPKFKDKTQFGEKRHENLVSEIKRYWDDKIKLDEEMNSQQQYKKKKITSKQWKQDSLTKRRGKQIVKNFLTAGKNNTSIEDNSFKDPTYMVQQQRSYDEESKLNNDVKLVDKWKKYWDEKLDSDNNETLEISSLKIIPQKKTTVPLIKSACSEKLQESISINEKSTDILIPSQSPVKQEIAEEVFKAFETSPKRFFGTSRKQIMNKIDAFLGKPHSTDAESPTISDYNHENGIVSSRISLYHNISHNEELSQRNKKHIKIENNKYSKVKDMNDNYDSVSKFVETKDKILDLGIKETKQNTITEEMACLQENVDCTTPDRIKEVNEDAFKINVFNIKEIYETKGHKHETEIDTYNEHKTISNNNKRNNLAKQSHKLCKPRRLSTSKSEMDIFNKVNNSNSCVVDIEKHKSCEDIPIINVKNFISLYETVTKSVSMDKQYLPKTSLPPTNPVSEKDKLEIVNTATIIETVVPEMINVKKFIQSINSVSHINKNNTKETISKPTNSNNQIVIEKNKKPYYDTITDIDVEIIEKCLEKKLESGETSKCNHVENVDVKTIEKSPEIELEARQTSKSKFTNLNNKTETEKNEKTYMITDVEIIEISPEREVETKYKSSTDYKSRFKLAKQFFQSLEELRPVAEKKPTKLNECELLLKQDHESHTEKSAADKKSKRKMKSHSLPSSEFSKIWSQLQASENNDNTKFVKISEKFNVNDLFNDVVSEGRLSRQGSFRGIPHKKAVLETFKSMENVSDITLSPYEIASKQLDEFAKEYNIKNVQTYLSEYPYLPTTDPSKYHSRCDTKASGLISRRELLNTKPRRNSVPDLRMNAKFIADL